VSATRTREFDPAETLKTAPVGTENTRKRASARQPRQNVDAQNFGIGVPRPKRPDISTLHLKRHF
jgi:hypothetical protein